MGKVLRALLSNAYKFSGDEVRVEVQGRRGMAGVAIRDRGIGMDAQALARAGERFWRADPSGARLGAGLGLAIARELCQLMDGVVELESQPGQGTTAWVLLPLID
jgi:signal transduction histidine kinase